MEYRIEEETQKYIDYFMILISPDPVEKIKCSSCTFENKIVFHKMFGTNDYEINYIIGIINGQRQIKFDNEILDKDSDKE